MGCLVSKPAENSGEFCGNARGPGEGLGRARSRIQTPYPLEGATAVRVYTGEALHDRAPGLMVARSHQAPIVPTGTEEQDAWGTNVDARWSRFYGAALVELAPAYGFGFVDVHPINRGKPRPAREAAAYLSGYFFSGKGKKAAITETVRSRVVPRVVAYVSRKLTALTFCTMRNMRRALRLFVWRCGRGGRPGWPTFESLQVLVVMDRVSPAFLAHGP